MARAYVKWFYAAQYDSVAAKDKIQLEIHFTGAEIPTGNDVAYGELEFDPGDPVSQLRPRVTAIVLFEAGARGYIVAKQDMCIPAVQQGV